MTLLLLKPQNQAQHDQRRFSDWHLSDAKLHAAKSAISVCLPPPAQPYSRRVCVGQTPRALASVLGTGAPESLRLPVFLRSGGAFHPPANLSKPVVYVGPGTGAAPFRQVVRYSRLQHRHQLTVLVHCKASVCLLFVQSNQDLGGLEAPIPWIKLADLGCFVTSHLLQKAEFCCVCGRGFLQHRQAQLAEYQGVPGDAWLFFGCRRPNEDFLYRSDWEGFKENGTLSHLHIAFSRAQVVSASVVLDARGVLDSIDIGCWSGVSKVCLHELLEETDSQWAGVSRFPGGVARWFLMHGSWWLQAEKVYVQSLMQQHGAALQEAIVQQGGAVFVCGDGSQMAKVRCFQGHKTLQNLSTSCPFVLHATTVTFSRNGLGDLLLC